MILTGQAIREAVDNEQIRIRPFEEHLVNPNSYDLHLGSDLMVYRNHELDTREDNPTDIIRIPEDGFLLKAKHFYLGHSKEEVGSDHFVPIIHNKSGIARLGLFIHITADLIDIGSFGNITFQLHPIVDIRIYPGMRVGQVSFWKPKGEISLYKGKYQGSIGPVASRSYIDQD